MIAVSYVSVKAFYKNLPINFIKFASFSLQKVLKKEKCQLALLFDDYWTVTDLARFRGLSTSSPLPKLV